MRALNLAIKASAYTITRRLSLDLRSFYRDQVIANHTEAVDLRVEPQGHESHLDRLR